MRRATSGEILCGASVDEVRTWAQEMITPGAAVIVDVETTDLDGAVIEVAVIDASSGDVLLDTLVDSGPVRIAPEAAAVHGISALDLLYAPQWCDVARQMCAAVSGRVILAYNADFDHGRITADCRRVNVVCDMTDRGRWQCVMAARSVATGTRLRLAGGHRALSDVHATRSVLLGLAEGRAAA
jgi:DNA polymerase III subunit epsilon